MWTCQPHRLSGVRSSHRLYKSVHCKNTNLIGQGVVESASYQMPDETWQAKNKPAAQAAWQTLPDETPLVGKIHPFSKIVVTFEPKQ